MPNKVLKLGIIGWPLGYSLSPLMHRAALKEAGLQGTYDEIKVRSEDLDSWLEREAPKLDGFNVTMPHKLAVYRWLERHGKVDEAARLIGAVNTVKVQDGRFTGQNTDAEGFSLGLPAEGVLKQALLMGAGGAAAAIGVVLVRKKIPSITIWNRHPEKAQELAGRLNQLKSSSRTEAVDDLKKVPVEKMELIINATPTGMNKHEETPIDFGRLRKGQVVVDIVYEPLETRLIHAARKQGCTVIRGDEMLAGQGAAAFEIWTGVPAAKTLPVMKRALNDHFAAAA